MRNPQNSWLKPIGHWCRGLLLLLACLLTVAEIPAVDRDFQSPEPEGEFQRPDTHVIGNILFTPDSQELVGVGMERRRTQEGSLDTEHGIIDFWDIKTRKLVRTLKQPSIVMAAVFTPDGRRLVTAGWDKKLRIFVGPTWQLEHTFNPDPPNRTDFYLAMLPDGKRFVSAASGYSSPRMWDLNNRQAISLPGLKELVTGVAVSKDGKRFAVAYSAPVTEIWDSERLEVVGRLQLEISEESQGVFSSVAFSPDGKTIATGYLYKRTHPVAIWDATTFKKLRDCYGFDERAEPAEAVAYSTDGKLLLACTGPDYDRPAHLVIWEVETGKLVYQFHVGKEGGMQMALSPDGRWLVHCSGMGTLRLWDFEKIRRQIGK